MQRHGASLRLNRYIDALVDRLTHSRPNLTVGVVLCLSVCFGYWHL